MSDYEFADHHASIEEGQPRCDLFVVRGKMLTANPGLREMDVVSWDDVEHVAAKIFSVWSDSTAECEWARRAWDILEKVGLTGYTFEIERARVCVRLLTLGHLYHEWCALAFEEGDSDFTDHVSEVADDLLIDRFHVGQLVGPDFVAGDDGRSLDAADEALAELMRAERRPVVEAIFAALGGEAQVFVSLWRTRPLGLASDGLDELDTLESTDAILNQDLTPEKAKAYEWVASHCPPR